MSQENVELMQRMYEAFARGDVETVLGQMDEGIEWNEAENFIYADRNPYVGPQAVLEGVFARIGEDWEVFEVKPEEFLDAGDRVVSLGRYNAKHKATGSEVWAQFAHVCSVRGGKVTSFQQYTDTKQFAEAVQKSGLIASS